MASVRCFSSPQATYRRPGGKGHQSWWAGESSASHSSKVPLPPPPWPSQPLEQDMDLSHLLTSVCPSAGHLPSLCFTSLFHKMQEIIPS